jgi:hypothetical protein
MPRPKAPTHPSLHLPTRPPHPPAPQAKFGIPVVAANQLELYSTAVLLASTKPPRAPRSSSWVETMDALGKESCRAYRWGGGGAGAGGGVWKRPNGRE